MLPLRRILPPRRIFLILILSLGNMLYRHFKNFHDVIVGKRIKHLFTALSRFDELALPENSELMRNCRFRHIEKFADIANSHFALEKRHKNIRPRTVAENLEKFRNVVNNVLRRHYRLNFFNNAFMRMLTFANLYKIVFHFYSRLQLFDNG